MSSTIFDVKNFEFPYRYKFAGQASDELNLFVTRENPIMLTVRRVGVVTAAAFLLGTGLALSAMVSSFAPASLVSLIRIIAVGGGLLFAVVGWWWVSELWRKSICILTTKRLIKFVYTTPVNRHILSLPLDMIVDTGAYTKGFIQALFKLETFTARSAAAGTGIASEEEELSSGRRVNRKYFYIENVKHAEDLQHYVNKVLYAFRQHHQHLPSFRPFIPELKGDDRKRFMEQYPEYWS